MDKPFDMPHVTIMDAKKAYNYVLSHVGATFPKRDAVDHRMVKSVKTGKAIYAKDAANYEFVPTTVKRRLPVDSYKKGIITDPRQVGGLPEYKVLLYLIPMVMECLMLGKRNMDSIPMMLLMLYRI